MNITIQSGTISQAVAISKMVPELENPYPKSEYEKRFAKTPHLVLIAYLRTPLRRETVLPHQHSTEAEFGSTVPPNSASEGSPLEYQQPAEAEFGSTNQPIAFKAGYQRDSDGSFYSWMGGVLPSHRKMGIAQMLANEQEDWAREQGYTSIRFKTRNRLKAMLAFALGNGFQIIGVDPMDTVEENRIWLEKRL